MVGFPKMGHICRIEGQEEFQPLLEVGLACFRSCIKICSDHFRQSFCFLYCLAKQITWVSGHSLDSRIMTVNFVSPH